MKLILPLKPFPEAYPSTSDARFLEEAEEVYVSLTMRSKLAINNILYKSLRESNKLIEEISTPFFVPASNPFLTNS